MTRWIQGVSTFRLPVEYVNPQTGEIERGIKATEAALLDIQRLIPKFDEMYRTDAKITHPILGNIGLDGEFLILVADVGARLPNTCEAFIGFSSDELVDILVNHPENYREIINTREGVHQELLKELGESYKILIYLVGYSGLIAEEYNIRGEDATDVLQQNLMRAYGYTSNLISIGPVPIGGRSNYFSISLPQEVANYLRQKYPGILIGPGNTLPLIACCKDALKEDGIRRVSQWALDVISPRNEYYLMREEG
jgi:hypothetical protein